MSIKVFSYAFLLDKLQGMKAGQFSGVFISNLQYCMRSEDNKK